MSVIWFISTHQDINVTIRIHSYTTKYNTASDNNNVSQFAATQFLAWWTNWAYAFAGRITAAACSNCTSLLMRMFDTRQIVNNYEHTVRITANRPIHCYHTCIIKEVYAGALQLSGSLKCTLVRTDDVEVRRQWFGDSIHFLTSLHTQILPHLSGMLASRVPIQNVNNNHYTVDRKSKSTFYLIQISTV
jgi:hypothetical protein